MASLSTSSTVNLTDAASQGFPPSTPTAGLVQAAYDRMVEFALRAQPMLRAMADKRPAKQAMPGATVALQIYKDLDTKTSTLTENVDVDTVSMYTPDIVNVTLAEYGNAALTTRKLDLFSLADVESGLANIIAFNMVDSLDEVVQNELLTGTQVLYGQGSSGRNAAKTAALGVGATSAPSTGDQLTAKSVRTAIAKLRANKVVPRKGSFYWAALHPEVSFDLRSEVGNSNWRDPHAYSDVSNIWAGEIGAFEGAAFIETPRVKADWGGAMLCSALGPTPTLATAITNATATWANASKTITLTTALDASVQVGYVVYGTGLGTTSAPAYNADISGVNRITAISGDRKTITTSLASTAVQASAATISFAPTVKRYATYFAGQQALAEAVAADPHVVIGPVVDRLMRFRPIGWYGVLGYKIYRDAALYRIETTSTINGSAGLGS